MRRIRVTGRFYVFLAMLAVGLFFIVREFWSYEVTESAITTGRSTYTTTMDAVIVRDESVASYQSDGRIVYLVPEGAAVKKDDVVVDLYYSHIDQGFKRLEDVRTDIRAYYQKARGLIIDQELDRLEANVQAQALEIKKMVQSNQIGNLGNVVSMLEGTMGERYTYLRQRHRDDYKLNNDFDEETTLLNNIDSWKTVSKADKDGVVSFYLDGYERALTPASLMDITPDQIRAVVAGKAIAAAKTVNAGSTRDAYKIASTDKWYVLLISSDANWNPIKGHVYQMQMAGVGGYTFSGTVISTQKNPGNIVAQIEVNADIGPMLGRRSGKMSISTQLTGFSVPRRAIATYEGKTGVWLSEAGGTFVPVEVLATATDSVLVEPIVAGTLQIGWRVLLQ